MYSNEYINKLIEQLPEEDINLEDRDEYILTPIHVS